MTQPVPPGAVTGIGSLPGTDPGEAARLVLGELPDLPHLAELPGRGVGADMLGRAAALLVDLPAEVVASGWRLAGHAGRDLRRARDLLSWDLDALEAAAAGHGASGRALKVQCAGPWTLAANLELASGHRIVTDPGATRDLAESLAEGLRGHLADVARRVPGAQLVLQLDEPSLPAVLAGRVPTPSGYGTVRAVEQPVVEQRLADVLGVAPFAAVHCCAPDVPVTLLRDAGARAVGLDAALVGPDRYDALGEAVDAGVALWLGVVPTDGTVRLDTSRARLFRLWDELGFRRGQLATGVVPTPTCGLAGLSGAQARHALTVLRDVGRAVLDAMS